MRLGLAVLVMREGVHRHHRPVLGEVAGERDLRALRARVALEIIRSLVVDRLRNRRVLLVDVEIGDGKPELFQGTDPKARFPLRRNPRIGRTVPVRIDIPERRRPRLRDIADENDLFDVGDHGGNTAVLLHSDA